MTTPQELDELTFQTQAQTLRADIAFLRKGDEFTGPALAAAEIKKNELEQLYARRYGTAPIVGGIVMKGGE